MKAFSLTTVYMVGSWTVHMVANSLEGFLMNWNEGKPARPASPVHPTGLL